MTDLEQRLRARLHEIAEQVPVSELPELPKARRTGLRWVRLTLAAAALITVVAAVSTVLDDESARLTTVDTAPTTTTPLIPTTCRDDGLGPILLTGDDGVGPWEFTVTGQAPTITLSIRFLETPNRAESVGSGSYTLESWTNLVEDGDLGTFVIEPQPTDLLDVEIVMGALPAQARAVRLAYADGRVTELCTVGLHLGLPIVFFVAPLHHDDPPMSIAAVDSDGNMLVTGDAQTTDDMPISFEFELNRALVSLPLRPALSPESDAAPSILDQHDPLGAAIRTEGRRVSIAFGDDGSGIATALATATTTGGRLCLELTDGRPLTEGVPGGSGCADPASLGAWYPISTVFPDGTGVIAALVPIHVARLEIELADGQVLAPEVSPFPEGNIGVVALAIPDAQTIVAVSGFSADGVERLRLTPDGEVLPIDF